MGIFEQVWNWISTNVTPILSSTTLVSVIGFITYFFRSRKSAKQNVISMGDYSSKLKKTLEKIDAIIKNEESRQSAAENISNEVYNLKDMLSQVLTKNDGTLSVLQTVYSAQLHDVSALKTINNIINNAKYTENKTRRDIAKNAEMMKQAAANLVATVNATAEDTKRIVGETSTNEVDENVGTKIML